MTLAEYRAARPGVADDVALAEYLDLAARAIAQMRAWSSAPPATCGAASDFGSDPDDVRIASPLET